MEDRHVVDAAGPLPFAAVFDGHDGACAAAHAAERLPLLLAERLDADGGADVGDSLAAAVRETEAEIMSQLPEHGGTTAVAVALRGARLTVANVGDSRAVMGTALGGAVRLSTDHKPNLAAEKARVTAAGGFVRKLRGIWRIGHASAPFTLSVSRALGDALLKRAGGVLSAEPDVFERELTPADARFIILASDGLWDALSDEAAVKAVTDELCKAGTWRVSTPAVRRCAGKLVRMAEERGADDNTTAVVLGLGWESSE